MEDPHCWDAAVAPMASMARMLQSYFGCEADAKDRDPICVFADAFLETAGTLLWTDENSAGVNLEALCSPQGLNAACRIHELDPVKIKDLVFSPSSFPAWFNANDTKHTRRAAILLREKMARWKDITQTQSWTPAKLAQILQPFSEGALHLLEFGLLRTSTRRDAFQMNPIHLTTYEQNLLQQDILKDCDRELWRAIHELHGILRANLQDMHPYDKYILMFLMLMALRILAYNTKSSTLRENVLPHLFCVPPRGVE